MKNLDSDDESIIAYGKKRKAMSPQKAASMRSRMVAWMESPCRCCLVAGAKMSMSRWKRSHQKGAESSMDGQEVVALTMARNTAFWRFEKALRFRE